MSVYLRIKLFLVVFLAAVGSLKAQGWKPAMQGINSYQGGSAGYDYVIEFKSNGPLGKNWIYGTYLDEDSLFRCIAYREGGTWKSLPFHFEEGSTATDIEMYGDTLYIAGTFGTIILEETGDTLPNTGLLKWYEDSLWIGSAKIFTGLGTDMSTKGDTLLIWGGVYYNPPQIIDYQFMTTDGGTSWQYPYDIIHPTGSSGYFGAHPHLQILDNGDIITINNTSPTGSPYLGLSRWDGNQWHAYGAGIQGGGTFIRDFEFYKGELYMGGHFTRIGTSSATGKSIARWDGNEWHGLAGGITGFVKDLFAVDSVLYCSVSGGANTHFFGDAEIPYFAGWDGKQWCGTYVDYEYPPATFGFINDTLYATFYVASGTANGDSISYMSYYDGDYLHGPSAVCSTPGLGEEETAIDVGLQVYPNPASAIIQLQLQSEPIKEVQLYTLSGKKVLHKTYTSFHHQAELDVSELPRGVYLLNVNAENYVSLLKN